MNRINLTSIAGTLLWLASAVKVVGFTWEAFQTQYQAFPIGGTQYLNQTGPGQKNDPAKVPAKPPTGKGSSRLQRQVAGFRDKNGKPLPFPPNSYLMQPDENVLIQWLQQHGWSNPQIVKYLRSLYLQVPSNLRGK